MKSRAVQITRVFFYLLAALWFASGIGYRVRNDGSTLYWIMASLMFASVLVFIALGLNITKKPVYWIGVILLAISIALTFADQFGWPDFIALVLFTIPLVIMIAKQNKFLAA